VEQQVDYAHQAPPAAIDVPVSAAPVNQPAYAEPQAYHHPAETVDGYDTRQAVAASVAAPRRRRKGLLWILIASGVVNIVALVLLFAWWTGRDSGDDVATTGGITPATSAAAETAAECRPTCGSSETTVATEAASPTVSADGTMISVAPTAENPTGAIRYAVFEGGQIHLRGFVPSQEVGDLHVSGAEEIMGPGSVVNEYQVDPTAPVETDTFPVYLADVVLFGFNSTELDPRFLPLLDTTPAFLQQNPTATVTVIARTDSIGSEEVNLEIATRRAQAVIDYWVSKGVDRSRVIADPRGEESASGSESEEQAAYDRRVEFVLNGLLG
jgi:outer membrane protein OmpA-like peptidoglycan-associated protein